MKYAHCLIIMLLIFIAASVGYSKSSNYNQRILLQASPLFVEKSKLNFAMTKWNYLAYPKSAVSFTNVTTDQVNIEYKQRGKAFIRSLLLPGSGERYLGQKKLAKIFVITEITLWASFIALRKYGKWIRDDAIVYAATHSDAQTDGKESQFFVDIGNYKNIYEYNDAKQRMRQFDKVYSKDAYFWDWDQDANRIKFENMRIASDQAIQRSIFVLGGIFANHLLSAIDAVWQTHRYNKKIKQRANKQSNFQIKTNYSTGEILFSVKKPF